MANRLMFEVGIQKAQGDYDKIYNEVMKLVEANKKPIEINVKFNETQGLKALTDLLKNLGDGKLLQPLVEKINTLQVSLAKFGAVPKDLDMSAVQKQLKAIDNTMANIEKKRSNMQKAGISKEEIANKLTADNGLLRSQREQLEKMTSMTEQAARIVVENYNKMREAAKNAGSGATIKVDGLETIETKVTETKAKVNALSVSIKELGDQLSKTNQNGSGTHSGVLGQEKINELKESIVSIIGEVNKLKEVFEGLGKTDGLTKLTETINGLYHNVDTFKDVFSTLSSAVNLTPTSEYVKKLQTDFDAAKAKVQELTEQLNTLSAAQKQVSESASKTGKSSQQIGDSQKAMFNRYSKLLADIQNKEREALSLRSSLGANNPFADSLRDYIIKLGRVRDEIKKIATSSGPADAITKGMSSENLAKLNSALAALKATYKETIADAKKLSSANEKLNATKREGASATNQLTESEQRLANAIKTSTESMRGQSMVLSDLRMMAYQYLSVWGAQNFGNKIIETGGLLEQQRLSLSAILGDMDKANELFGQVKALALKSPFGVVQIDQMTKQLAAYDFEYEELFDWTKRLADISAATGTEVSRLALALGHVRAEGALSGYTLRQFAMGNVPLLKMLSEARGVSTKEIRDLVRKKEISDKEVQAVLMKLTDEGGMFYNAQEVMSQALNAKFKNLRDAFDIMYGEIAESSIGDMLKDIATALTSAAKQWKRFGADILSVAASFGIMKLSMMAWNKLNGASSANVLKSAMAAKRQEMANLQLAASYRTLTADEQYALANKNKLVAADIKLMLETKKLTTEELLALVARKKLNAEEAKTGVALAVIDKETKRLTLSQLQSMQHTRKWTMFWTQFRITAVNAIRAVGAALKTLGPMLAIGAVVDLIMRRSQQKEKASDMAEEMTSNMYGNLKNVKELFGSLSDRKPKNAEELKNAVEEMTTALKDAGKYTDGLDRQINSVDTLSDKYKILFGELRKVSDEYLRLAENAKFYIEKAMDVGGTWTGIPDTMAEDLEELSEANVALRGYRSSLNFKGSTLKQLMKNWMFNLTDKHGNRYWKSEYEDLDWRQMRNKMSDIGLAGSFDKYVTSKGRLNDETKELYEDYIEAVDDYNEALEDVKKKIPENAMFLRPIFTDLMKQGNFNMDVKNWDENAARYFGKIVEDYVSKLPYDLDVKEDYKEMILRQFGLDDGKVEIAMEVTPEVKEDEDLEQWQLRLKKRFEKFGIDINITPQTTTSEVIKKLKALHKEAQEEMKTKGKILLSVGIDPESEGNFMRSLLKLGKITDKGKRGFLQQVLKDYNEQRAVDAAVEAEAKRLGADLTDDKNKGSHEDKNAKAVRERVRVIKEAADAFQYWREKVGAKNAWKHVQSEFGEVLKTIGITADNIEDVRSHLKKIPETKEYKAIKDQKVKTEINKEIAKDEDKYIRKDFEKDSKEYVSYMTRQIEELTRKWEIYNSVVESTGDRALAGRMSGVTPGATVADLKRMNVAQMAGVNINFDRVLDMSDKEIEEYVKGLGIAEENIEGIANGLKDWRKAQQDITKSDIQNYAKWLGSLVDLTSILSRNQEEYNRVLEETKRLEELYIKTGGKEGITSEEAERRIKAAGVQRDSKNWSSTNMYARLYSTSQQMAKDEFAEAYALEMQNLKDLLDSKSISLADYGEKVEKLNKIAAEFGSKGFLGIGGGLGAYLGGGYQGLINHHWEKAKNYRMQGNLEDAKREEDKATSMMKAQKATEQVIKAFQDLSNGANLLVNMFDALGMEGAANAFGDAAGVLGGVASGAQSLSAFGPWGAAAGATIGGITAIAQLNDKHQQRLIDKLQENVDALEANTQMIKATRERALGYDTGELRNAMASRYSGYDTTKKSVKYSSRNGSTGYSSYYSEETPAKSAAQKAMYEYYGGGTSGRGYSQELQNLRDQRKDFFDMYNAENDKKKKSKKTLNEYKQKIAELDAEIMDYLQNLTKELWGIDLKGWASQISDALMTAFENGTSAATAFGETATDILKGVFKQMMTIGLLEPMMNKLQKTLFGEIDKNTGEYTGGIVNMEDFERDPEGTANRVLSYTMQFFRNTMNPMITAYQKAFSSFSDEAAQYGFDVKGSKSNTVEGIRSAASEETMGIVAGYLASIRQDVSAKRVLLTYWSEEQWPSFTEKFDRQQATLNNMFSSVRAIEVMMRDGSGAMYESVNRMSRKIDLAITPDGKMRV